MIRRVASILASDTRGAIAPMMAIFGVALIGTMGVALDFGLYYSGSRNLQTVTEAAALSAAVDPANAQTRAIAFLQRNGYAASNLTSVEVGGYCADNSLAPTARFMVGGSSSGCAGNTAQNAVRLHTTGQSNRYFTSIFGKALIPTPSGTATAARIDEAGIQVTSGVLALDAGLVNSLLSALVGSNISLTGLQIQALQASNVDAGLMFDALAARVGETGTYSDLVARTVSLADLMAACQAATTDASLLSALQALSSQAGTTIQVPLKGLFGLGVWKKMPVGGAGQKQSLRAGVNAYQLISFALQTNNRSAALTKGLAIVIPGVTQVILAGTASGTLERPRFAFGPANETSVSTSALRILLKIRLANLGGLLDGLGLSVVNQLLLGTVSSSLNLLQVDLPLLIEVAPASVDLKTISCGQEAATDARVTVAAQSGLLYANLGTLPSDVMTQPFRQLTSADVKTVNLVNALGLLTVDIRARIGPVLGKSATLGFRQQAGGDGIIGKPPYGGTAARVGNGSQLAALLGGLGGNLEISATLLGINITTGQLIANVTKAVIEPLNALAVTPLVDPLLDALLRALGIQLGFADTWVSGVRCGVPVLV